MVVWGKIECLASLLFSHWFAIMVVDRVRVGGFWLGAVVKAVDVLHDALGECHKAIGSADIDGRKEFVKQAWLVRYHVVYQCDSACLAIAFGNALNDTIAWCEERHPIAGDKQIWLLTADILPYAQPVEWVAGVYALRDVQVGRRLLGGVLRFTREEEGWVLQGESDDFHLMSFRLQLARQSFVEGGETATKGICCAEDDDVHVN